MRWIRYSELHGALSFAFNAHPPRILATIPPSSTVYSRQTCYETFSEAMSTHSVHCEETKSLPFPIVITVTTEMVYDRTPTSVRAHQEADNSSDKYVPLLPCVALLSDTVDVEHVP